MIAGRYLRSRRRDGFVSVISLFSFLGIMLGVATLIVVMAVFNGFRAELLDKILGFGGHATVSSYEGGQIADYEALAQRLAKVDGVISAMPLIEGQALASSSRNNTGILIRGLREADLKSLKSINNTSLQTALKDVGTPDTAADLTGFDAAGGVAIGAGLRDKHLLGLGSNLTIISPDGPETIMGSAPRIREYPVVAVFKMGMSIYDDGVIYMPLAEAQEFLSKEDGVSGIELMVRNPDTVDAMLPALINAAGPDVVIRTWKGRNEAFFSALTVERNVMFFILSMIVLVAALNIISGLIMLVKDKGRDIGILRTMGATRGAIQRVFFMTGAAIGVTGTIAGFFLGVILCLNVERIRLFVGWLSNTETLNPELYYLSQLPAEMDPWQTLAIVLMALVLSFLATLYPSWRAAKLDPVEALRYE